MQRGVASNGNGIEFRGRFEIRKIQVYASHLRRSICTRIQIVSILHPSVLFLSILRCHFVSLRWKSLFSNFALQRFRVPLPLSLSLSLSPAYFALVLSFFLPAYRLIPTNVPGYFNISFQLTWETNRWYFVTCTNCGNFI